MKRIGDPVDVSLGFFYRQRFQKKLFHSVWIDLAPTKQAKAFSHAVKVAGFAKQAQCLFAQGFRLISVAPGLFTIPQPHQCPGQISWMRQVINLVQLTASSRGANAFRTLKKSRFHYVKPKRCEGFGADMSVGTGQRQTAAGKRFTF